MGEADRQCHHEVTGPMVGPPGRKRPTWRRLCKRKTRIGDRYCKQHKPWRPVGSKDEG